MSAGLVCARDGVPTQLTCASCRAPVCPRCFVRTEVGLRCPACGSGGGETKRRRRVVPLVLVPAVVVAAVAAVVVLRSGGGTSAAKPQSAVTYRTMARPDLGYSVDVPTTWTPAPDNSPTTLSYAGANAGLGFVRVTMGRDDRSLSDHVNDLVASLAQQGGKDFVQTPTDVSGSAAIRLDYSFPTSATAGSVYASRTSILVNRENTSFSFQLGTTDPVGARPVVEHIVASLRLL